MRSPPASAFRRAASKLVVFAGLTLLLAACGAQAPPAPGERPPAPPSDSPSTPVPSTAAPASLPGGPPRLLLLSSINGYVEPCGCTVDLTLGGIDRIATRIAEERRQGPAAVLLVGTVLFDPHVKDPHLADQEAAKAEVLARALARIGVDAAVPTHTELKYGAGVFDPLRKLWTPPDVTVNIPGGAPRLLRVGDVSVGVFGLVDPDAGPVPGGLPSPAEAAARAAVATLRGQGAQIIVGLAGLPRRQVRTLAKTVEGVDLWALGEAPTEEEHAQPAGSGFVLEAGDRGRNLARILLLDAGAGGPMTDPAGERARALKGLDLQIKMRDDALLRTKDTALGVGLTEARARREALAAAPLPTAGKRFEYNLMPIPKEVTPEREIEGWLAAYNLRLKEINLASAAPVPPVPEGGSGYSGGKECVDCHEESQAVWLGTPHAKAWETLVKANKTFDAECVSCHVTGWLMPGGVNLKKLDGRTDVQCEACHGPGAKHVEVGGDDATTQRHVGEKVCVVCHNRFHSPKFDYATYLPKVLGPGHARKL